jgi:hypothetical protein
MRLLLPGSREQSVGTRCLSCSGVRILPDGRTNQDEEALIRTGGNGASGGKPRMNTDDGQKINRKEHQ